MQSVHPLSPFSFLFFFPSFFSFYLIPSALVNRHVPVEQRAVREAAAAFRAAEGLLGLLVAVPDVLLQRAVALVATRAVRAGEQLGEQIGWSSWVER